MYLTVFSGITPNISCWYLSTTFTAKILGNISPITCSVTYVDITLRNKFSKCVSILFGP